MQAPMQDFALYKCKGHYLPNSGSNHLIQVGAHLIQVALCTSYKQQYTSLIQDTRFNLTLRVWSYKRRIGPIQAVAYGSGSKLPACTMCKWGTGSC